MTRIALLTFLSLLLITSCADSDATVQRENVPWAEAGFLNPLPTKLTFINESDGYARLYLNMDNYPIYFDDLVPDSLAAGERFEAVVEIHRPRLLLQSWSGQRLMRPVLPGKDRTLVFTGTEIEERSENATEYNYLDAVLEPLLPAGRMPPVIENITDHQEEVLATGSALLDSVPVPEEAPDYLRPILERTVVLNSYKEALGMRFYYMVFRKDTFSVPQVFIDSVRALLVAKDAYQTFQYTELHLALTMYEGEENFRKDLSHGTNRSESLTGSFLAGYPATNRRDDAVATHLHEAITNPRNFLDKQQAIDTLLSTLPAAYREKLDGIAEAQARKVIAENDIADFLATPLLTSAGDTVAPAEMGDKPLRLYKFWFAGCYPCLTQQPNEVKLLADHPEVDLIYVAFHTDRDYWPVYLDKHKPPTNLHLYATRKQDNLIRSAAGRLGAPTYVMTDAAGETICRPCPKPSDPLLENIINESTEREDIE